MNFLIHLATGPQDPTRVALAFLVARTACEGGHGVEIFVAGDGVNALRMETREALVGIGTGKLSEHVEALVAAGVRFHLSGMSCKARGIAADSLGGLPADLVPPTKLIELAAVADRVLVY